MVFQPQRKVVLPTLILLVLTAPLSWPTYCTCLQILSLAAGGAAHAVFRRYQWSLPSITVVNCLMYMLSLFLQAIQVWSCMDAIDPPSGENVIIFSFSELFQRSPS